MVGHNALMGSSQYYKLYFTIKIAYVKVLRAKGFFQSIVDTPPLLMYTYYDSFGKYMANSSKSNSAVILAASSGFSNNN